MYCGEQSSPDVCVVTLVDGGDIGCKMGVKRLILGNCLVSDCLQPGIKRCVRAQRSICAALAPVSSLQLTTLKFLPSPPSVNYEGIIILITFEIGCELK